MTEQEKAPSSSQVAASEAETATPRCSAVCGKQIDPAHNPDLRCQSQCDQREGHTGGHNCPTHGQF